MNATRIALTICAAAVATACSPSITPENLEPVAQGRSYQAQYRAPEDAAERRYRASSIELNAMKCAAPPAAGTAAIPPALGRELLSRGDLLRIEVGEDEVFTGDFEVSRDGALKAPYVAPIAAHGRAVEEVENALRRRLVDEGYYPAPGPRVSIRIAEFASASVHVAGAVFEPGGAEIGRATRDRDTVRQAAQGASTEGRNLSAALRAVGGVRPDADLAQVRIVRGGREHVLDLSAAVEGRRFPDVMLLTDDEVIVPTRGCFQEALMAPTSITAPGVKVFMSNLTKPADANALSAVGKEARELRYGTRFIQAVVGMNCVGGAKLTNADRSAVLFTRNPTTGRSIVIERRIEDLLRGADRDELDPFILPGDALACYDSTVTDITELARSLGVTIAAAAFAL